METEILIGGKPNQIQNYVNAFERIGVKAIGLFECTWKQALEFQGLVLPGGGDIAPELFGEENQGSINIDETLDRIQLMLLAEYCRERKPVLGICKGIQIINVYFGGTIQQHLKNAHVHAYQNGDQYHMTITKQGSILEYLYSMRFPVNSAHHQGIDKLGEGLEAIQFAEDQLVEGIVHKELPIIGVQWHPERMIERSEDYAEGARLLEFWIQHFPKH